LKHSEAVILLALTDSIISIALKEYEGEDYIIVLTKNINIGPDLLELLNNVTGVWFLGDTM